VNRRTVLIAAASTALLAVALVPRLGWATQPAAKPAGTPTDWLQFAFDEQKSADNTLETAINTSNVGKLKQLFKVPLTDAPDGAPVLLASDRPARARAAPIRTLPNP